MRRGGFFRGGFLPIGGKGFGGVGDGLELEPGISGAVVGWSRRGDKRKLVVSVGGVSVLGALSLGVLPRADGLPLRWRLLKSTMKITTAATTKIMPNSK